MKTSPFVSLGALLLGLSFPALARAATPWSVRLRATYLETVDKSSAFSALGINFAEDAVVVSDRLIPEIDINYAFTDTLAAELVLTIPQEHHVDLKGAGRLGSFKHLPPTLLLQYRPHFDGSWRPYLGVGVNVTLIFDDDLSVTGVPLELEDSSVGLAVQAGVDYRLSERWHLSVDVKRASLRTDVRAGGATLTEAKLDPWLWSLGVRYDL